MKKISILALVAVFACVGCKKASFVDQIHDSTELWPAYDAYTQLYGYIDATGTYVIRPQFKSASSFFVGDYAVVSNGGKKFFINKDGKAQPAASFDNVVNSFMNNYAVVELDGNYGLLDRDLQYAIQPVHVGLTDASENGLVGYYINGKAGYLNTSGERAIDPVYDLVRPFIDGVAVVRYEDYYGVIDAQGTYIVHPINEYEKIISLGANRLAYENEKGLYGLMDTKGKIISLPTYKYIGGIVEDLDTHIEDGNLFVAYSEFSESYAFIDLSGNIKFSLPENCEPYPFCEGYAYIYNYKSESGYFIDVNGSTVLTLNKNERCYHGLVHNGLILVVNKETGVYSYKDMKGKTIFSWEYPSLPQAPHRSALDLKEGEMMSNYYVLGE